MNCLELLPFLPSRDFAASQSFYTDLGFTPGYVSADLAHFRCDACSFLLQNFYVAELAHNLMLQLIVGDVAAWWTHVGTLNLPARYGVRTPAPPVSQPWGMRDFTLADPSGVLWRIAQRI